MAEKRRPRRTWVHVSRKELDLRAMARLLCGRRLTPSGALPLTCVAVWYATLDGRMWAPSGSKPLFCSAAERERWDQMSRTYREAVSDALAELHRSHGGKGYPATDPHSLMDSLRSSTGRVRFRWDPLGRFAASSAEAQREFLVRVQRADRDYRRVRKEIQRRLQSPDAERREAEEHRRAVIQQAAGRRVWVYREDEYEGARAILVYRDDMPCRDWPGRGSAPSASPACRPLDIRELETALVKRVRTSPHRIIWYFPACDAVEAECYEQGVEISFWGLANEVATHTYWWSVKTDPTTSSRSTSSRSRSVHVTSHHSSHGVGSEGSFGTSF